MWETSARLLKLLSLLQARRDWPGAALADRLGVSERTVRRDVDRLRDLGYPVHATRGTDGGYRLGAGAAMPPLLLDDEEAVAVAVSLRTGVRGAVSGVEETSLRALAKLEQVLPSRLRRRVTTLQQYTVAVPPDTSGPTVDASVLTVLSAACRDSERIRFDYRSYDGTASRREIEPYRLVNWGRRWYLVGFDLDRADWRTFRVDRIDPRTPSGPRFTPRELPAEDLAAYVSSRVSAAAWRYQARIVVHAPAAQVADRISPAVGTVEPIDEERCLLHTGADSIDTMAVYVSLLDTDFEILDPPELADRIRTLAARYHRATNGSAGKHTAE
ncbi:MAG: helix-turn-helix transcriptional regulator [Micromonosporaceae bacterium]